MHYGKIKEYDIANGPGCRVSIFVSGCETHCEGCFNKETWDFRYGKIFVQDTMEEVYKMLDKPGIAGLTILGGEPLHMINQCMVEAITSLFKSKYPEKDLWIYTGYTYEGIPRTSFTNKILKNTDVLVDGPFIESGKDITLQFRGSRNQRIIDMNKTRELGEVILWEDEYV